MQLAEPDFSLVRFQFGTLLEIQVYRRRRILVSPRFVLCLFFSYTENLRAKQGLEPIEEAMSIISTFSKRKRLAEKAGKPDILQYEELPEQFRVQATHIIADALGFAVLRNPFGDDRSPTFDLWFSIFKTQCREQGVYTLARTSSSSNPQSQCLDYIFTSRHRPGAGYH